MREGTLAGKVALVTGAARGLGRAYALHLARLGADVVINDIDLYAARQYNEALSDGAETVSDEIRAMGRRSLGIVADVTDPAACKAMVAQIVDELGRVDILVNNAGGQLAPNERSYAAIMPPEDLQFIMNINLMGTIYCCQAVAPVMQAQRSGRIVNVGSQSGLRASGEGGGYFAHYGVAKAGIHQYTRYLAAELGPFGINVNCIAPGLILSSRAIAGGRNSDATRARVEPQIPLRRMGWPEDCAKVIEFLVTDLSDYVTGQVIVIDGGINMF
ncbi:MAG TPA: SDR family NAD(P)-dependent oxidoreductase [Roseiflexaceae bacterium]|jgi:NAD(P)-dependent dehydrogenase (short-subunit alcohol dehydrogenase family)|nr:SDR family NAD(P)-dependent oxidoreductase [Roseiflexaceae bacterium]